MVMGRDEEADAEAEPGSCKRKRHFLVDVEAEAVRINRIGTGHGSG